MTVEINSLARSRDSSRTQNLRALLIRYADVVWMIALALVAGAYSLQYHLSQQPIPHDTTFHIYAAQQMLEGHPIYRDVAIIKAPLADFAMALTLLVTRAFGMSDVLGARLMSLGVVMATTSMTYLAGRVLFRARAVGVIAGLVMATWNFYGMRAVTGPEPKEFVIFFALLAFVLLAQKHWGWAGASAAMSALAWQPALLVAALVFCFAFLAPWLEIPHTAPKQNRNAALRNFARALLGFAAPFALTLLYLGANNALQAAFNATIGANVIHFNNNQARVPLLQTMDSNLAEIIQEGALYCYSYNEYWLNGLGILGFIGILATQIIGAVRAKRLPINLNVTPLVLYTFGFAAFTLIDFDFCPDLIPLLPVMALGVGWLAFHSARVVANSLARAAFPIGARGIERILLVWIGFALIVVYWFDAWGYQLPGATFSEQLAVVTTAQEYLMPGDRVLSFGNALVPVELHLQNATKILHLGSKSGLGVLTNEPGGMQGMIDALDAQPPKLIVLARENYPDWAIPFYAWLEQHYDPLEAFPRVNMRILILRP